MSPRELPPTSAFAHDDGSADPALAAVVGAYAAGRSSLADVVAALSGTRVLVPVLAHAEVSAEQAAAEHAGDSTASAGVVGLQIADGRTALPVFSSVATLAAWRPDARPVPAEASRAAQSAVSDGWPVLVLDPAGPTAVTVPRPAVVALAEGRSWEPAVADGAVVVAVRDAVRAALEGLDGVVACAAVPGGRAEVAVDLTLRAGLDRQQLDALLQRVGQRLAADPVAAERVDSFELRLRSA
ncbi:SseB family protein [Cellulomonas sp. NTE-D12]|uniref:SseB family protein n=1 Tax=Cellulomonas sp. NTE-D12 TaxID=2962632 RepID=UPI0030813332|nr:hypothetical protein CELD12_20190 [Cellulomonas sp. NTE-D12]